MAASAGAQRLLKPSWTRRNFQNEANSLAAKRADSYIHRECGCGALASSRSALSNVLIIGPFCAEEERKDEAIESLIERRRPRCTPAQASTNLIMARDPNAV